MSIPERAGWYDDPEDDTQLRYFDGVIWSDHRVPRRTRSAEPTVTSDAGQPGDHTGPGRDVFGRPSGAPTQQPGWGPPPAHGGQASGAPTTADGQPLASFGARASAYLVDTAL